MLIGPPVNMFMVICKILKCTENEWYFLFSGENETSYTLEARGARRSNKLILQSLVEGERITLRVLWLLNEVCYHSVKETSLDVKWNVKTASVITEWWIHPHQEFSEIQQQPWWFTCKSRLIEIGHHSLRKPRYHWVTSSISWDLEENVIPESMKY